MLQTRNWNIDLAKALAMLLVVMQHAWSMLGLDDPTYGLVCGVYRAISTVGVPLFVFVSGALLLSRAPEPLKVFYKKRLNRLLVPFLLFASLMYVVSLFTGQYDWWNGDVKTALLRFIPSLLENKINILHWFVHMLLVIYLLTPFLQRALSSLSQREIEGILLVWMVGMLLRQYYPALNMLAYTTGLWKYLGVYIAGYYVTQYRVGEKRYFYFGLVATILLFLLDALTDCAVHLGVPLTAITIGVACLNLPALYPISSQSYLRRVVINFSRYSYTIYLLHILVIRAIYLVAESYFTDMLIGLIPLIITPLIMIVFYLACTLYDKTKWLPNNLIGIG